MENDGAQVESQQDTQSTPDVSVPQTQQNTEPAVSQQNTSRNSDPLPPEARALLNDPTHKSGVDALLEHTRRTATQPLRNQIEEARGRIAELESQQRSRQTAPAEQIQPVVQESENELVQRLLGLEDRLNTVQEFMASSAINSFRVELLRTIPAETLPPEMHGMVVGNSREELSDSLRRAIENYNALRSRISPSGQVPQQPVEQSVQQPVTQQVVQQSAQIAPNMPAALQAPENGATSPPSQINSGTVMELAQKALRTRDPQDLRAWEEASQNLVMSELQSQRQQG